MAMDYYSDTDSESAPEQANTTQPDDQGSDQIALIPRSALEGKDCKVGDRLTFEVTGIDEDSIEVKMTSGESENESPEEQSSEMDSMMSDENSSQGY
jgi:HSP20 family molecular chaperone IbpA